MDLNSCLTNGHGHAEMVSARHGAIVANVLMNFFLFFCLTTLLNNTDISFSFNFSLY